MVVDLVMNIVHIVSVLFGIVLMRSVECEPLADFEHGTQSVQVHREGKFEVVNVNDRTFSELLDFRQIPQSGQHINKYELM